MRLCCAEKFAPQKFGPEPPSLDPDPRSPVPRRRPSIPIRGPRSRAAVPSRGPEPRSRRRRAARAPSHAEPGNRARTTPARARPPCAHDPAGPARTQNARALRAGCPARYVTTRPGRPILGAARSCEYFVDIRRSGCSAYEASLRYRVADFLSAQFGLFLDRAADLCVVGVLQRGTAAAGLGVDHPVQIVVR